MKQSAVYKTPTSLVRIDTHVYLDMKNTATRQGTTVKGLVEALYLNSLGVASEKKEDGG